MIFSKQTKANPMEIVLNQRPPMPSSVSKGMKESPKSIAIHNHVRVCQWENQNDSWYHEWERWRK